jgi:glycerophosphoryl diester phosphodiesterase
MAETKHAETKLLALVAAAALLGIVSPAMPAEPLVIAHRGASGYLPEHTLPAYALGYGQGADYVEPDLVLTKDGVFICLHDIHLEATTDVERVFPERKRADGRWYAADFALEEIRTLRAHERLEDRFPQDAAGFAVPTFEELLELVAGLNRTTGRKVGVYPELKAPAWHREQGLPMEERFLEVVRRHGYRGRDAAIFVQCFERPTLERLRALGSELPQVMLLGGEEHDPFVTEAGLGEVAKVADAIGPAKDRVLADPKLVARAHSRGLKVHPYTFRADRLEGYQTFDAELERFYVELGVDGLFTDFPDLARQFLVKRGLR